MPRSSAATPMRARRCACAAWARSTRTATWSSATRMWDFDGQEIFKRAVAGMASHSAHDVLQKARQDRRRYRSRRSRTRRTCASSRSVAQAHRHADGSRVTHRAPLRQHVRGDGPGRAGRSARRRPDQARLADADAGLRRRPYLVLAPDPLGRAHDAAWRRATLELPPSTQTALETCPRVHRRREPHGRSDAGLTRRYSAPSPRSPRTDTLRRRAAARSSLTC